MRKRILITSILSFFSICMWAVMASPDPHTITLPDGSEKVVRLIGDEYFSYYTTLDGKPLRMTDNGFFVEDPSAAIEPIDAHTIRHKPQSAHGAGDTSFPSIGSPHSIVILFGFKDEPFGQSKADFEALLNESGYSYNGATGSCRDYYIASSDSLFQPIFDVYGPYCLTKTREEYLSAQPKYGSDALAEAVHLAVADGLDFSKYDYNNDKQVDNIFFYYAGYNQAEGAGETTIWPHQGSLANYKISYNGKSVSSYACTSEYRGNSGKVRCGIGTFCHEFGHVLGLPDFYDTNYKYYTVGNWDIMCSGSYNNDSRTPPTYSAYERFYLGWLTPTQLQVPGEYSLAPMAQTGEAFLLTNETSNLDGHNPNPSEFFILEYRDGTLWDAYLPGTGMLVWHIDYSSAAWSSNTPNNGPELIRMHLEEANGVAWNKRQQGENGRASDPYPGTLKKTEFNPTFHNGTPLGTPIFNIAEEKGLIRFMYIGDGSSSVTVDKENLEFVTTVSDDNKIVDWTPLEFNIKGIGVDPNESLTIKATKYLKFYAGEVAPARSNKAWQTTLSLNADIDSTIIQKVWVSFIPTKRDCDVNTQTITIQSPTISKTISATYQSPRPTYVQTPEVNPVSNISPYSFRFSWVPESDATEYFLTLYKVSEGVATFLQGFENFNSAEAVRNEGWESTTNATTTSAKSEGNRALYLKATGDCITTEDYQSAVSEISFWINAFSTDVDTVGVIEIEGWNGTDWVTLNKCRTLIKSTTKKKVFAYSFGEAESYSRFRLSYSDNGGSGCAMDAFTATCTQNIEYIYKGTDLSVYAVDDPAYTLYDFTNLTPSTTYYCSVQASDAGMGCEEHRTALSAPLQVTTLAAGADADKYLTIGVDSINYDAPTRVVYVPNPANGNMLQIFDWSGRLVYQCEVIAGISAYPIPAEQMNRGAIYIIKYIEQNDKGALKMKRKQRFAKFVL